MFVVDDVAIDGGKLGPWGLSLASRRIPEV